MAMSDQADSVSDPSTNADGRSVVTDTLDSSTEWSGANAAVDAADDPVGRLLEKEFGRARFYVVNPRRITFREVWFGQKLLAPIGWLLLKLRGKAVVSSTDDLAVESLLPLVEPVEEVPGAVGDQIRQMRQDLEALGFVDVVQQSVQDARQVSSTALWTMRSVRQPEVVARVHLRMIYFTVPIFAKLYFEFITEQAGGSYVWTLSGGPDLLAPPTCRVTRLVNASAADLLAAHDRARSEHAAESTSAMRPTPVRNAEETLVQTERLHILVRDFHLKRGVFEPESQREVEQRRTLERVFAEAIVRKSPRIGVLSCMQMTKLGRPGGVGGVWLLLCSLAAFLALGMLWDSWFLSLMLVPVLFIHELGHLVAMKAFGYRDLKMFFLPGFGAAVTGRVDSVAAWKRVVVALAGPIPSIVIAIVLGLSGVVLKVDWATKAALLMLAINGFNLLPILPLDGGHVANLTIFCRHYLLEITFRAIAGVALVLIGFGLGAKLLGYLGIAALLGLPLAYKHATLTRSLQREGVLPREGAETIIDVDVADRVAGGVMAAQPKAKHADLLAQHAVHVYDMLRFRPPGIFASMFLLAVHGAAIVFTIIFVLIFGLAARGELDGFLRDARNQAKYAVAETATSIQVRGATPPLSSGANALVATYSSDDRAAAAFERLSRNLPANQALGRFSNTVVVRFDSIGDEDRKRLLGELRAEAGEAFATSDTLYPCFQFSAVATSKQAAKSAREQLNEYFGVCLAKRLIAPWSEPGPDADQLAARRAFLHVQAELDGGWRSPEYKAIMEEADRARRDGDNQGAKKLWEKASSHLLAFRKRIAQEIVDRPPSPIHADIARRFLAIEESARDADSYGEVLSAFAAAFGQVPENAPDTAKVYADRGYELGRDRFISIYGLKFGDPIHGPGAFAAWLKSKGFIAVRYAVSQCDDDEEEFEPGS